MTDFTTEIKKKQFLRDQSLHSYIVAKEVTEIGDWAFAGCRELVRIAIPDGLKRIGRNAFADCSKLEEVHLYESLTQENVFSVGSDRGQACAELMAIAVRFFPEATELLEAWREGQKAWIATWDQACHRFIDRPEEEGYRPFLAGGEEDYEDDTVKQKEYCLEKRLIKAGAIYKRLESEEFGEWFCMEEDDRERFRRLLRENDMALEYLKKVTYRPGTAVRIYEEAGILTQENGRIVLDGIPPENVELRALLLQKMGGIPGGGIGELWL